MHTLSTTQVAPNALKNTYMQKNRFSFVIPETLQALPWLLKHWIHLSPETNSKTN